MADAAPRFDAARGELVATVAQLDALADPAAATSALLAQLRAGGLLDGDDPVAALEAVAATWAAPLATLRLRIRRAGAELVVTGVADDDLALLLTPLAGRSQQRQVLVVDAASVPRRIAQLTGLGLREPHPAGQAPVPLSWAAVEHALAGADDAAAADAAAAARALAGGLAPAPSIDAVLARPSTRWTLTTAGTARLRGTIDQQIDVLDPGPAAPWLIAALAPEDASAVALPVSVGQIWMLLGSALAVAPAGEDGAGAVAARPGA